MISNWLKVYWYNTRRNAVYFILNVLGLAIGIASVVLASLYYLEEASYDKWNPFKNEVYIVETNSDNFPITEQFYPLGRHLKERYAALDSYMYFLNSGEGVVTYGEKNMTVDNIYDVQDTFFEFFPFEFVYGDPTRSLVNPNDIAIDKSVASQLFGDTINPVGKQIEIVSSYDPEEVKMVFVVSAVYDIGDSRSSLAPTMIMSSINSEIYTSDDWTKFSASLCVKTSNPDKIKTGIMELRDEYVAQPMAKERGISLEEFRKDSPFALFTEDITLHRLADCRMLPNKYLFPSGSANVQMLNIMVYMSIVILLLAVFNFANLSMTQTIRRGKEIGVRKVLGANKVHFFRQSILECFLEVSVAFLLAVCMIEVALPFINIYLETTITFSVVKDIEVLLSVFGFIILVCGSIPVLVSLNIAVPKLLKGTFIWSKRGKRLGNAFLIIQFSIACFFIVGALLVSQQVNYMLNKNLGFKGDQVVNVEFLSDFRFDGKRSLKYESFKAELKQLIGVEDVGTSAVAFGTNRGGVFGTLLKWGDQNKVVDNVMVDEYFFDILDIRLKEGRMLSKKLASDSINNVMVNESFIRAMNMDNPIGTKVKSMNKDMTIVGVVQDFNIVDLKEAVVPQVYAFMDESPTSYGLYSMVYIKIKPEQMNETLLNIEKLWEKYNTRDKDVFAYSFVDKQFAETFYKVKLEKLLFTVLSFFVVFISLFGLYAVSSFTIGSRLKEIAIRKVLGADTGELIRTMILQYVIFCLLGFFLSIFPSYYFLEKWLSDYAFRIEIGVLPYVICLVIILVLTISIVFTKAYQATKVDVVKYIKYE